MKKKEILFDLKQPYVFKKVKIPKYVSYNPSYWLFHKQYFFKYPKHAQQDTGELVGEIVVSKLCNELGVDCVECGYAINEQKGHEKRGIMSKSFLSEKEEAITLSEIRDKEVMKDYPKELYFQMMVVFARACPITFLFKFKDLHVVAHSLLYKHKMKSKLLMPFDSTFIEKNKKYLEEIKEKTRTENALSIDECERRIQMFATENGLTVSSDTRFKLQQMAIIDAITKQFDRHAGNISIIYDKKQKTARIAPMYDNGMCEQFGIDAPIMDYPLQVNCHIKLSEKDIEEINNPKTKISQFFKSVCEFYQNGKAKQLFNSMKEEFCIMDSIKEKHLNQDSALLEREKTDAYWAEAEQNYKKGLDYLKREMSSSKSCRSIVEKRVEKI